MNACTQVSYYAMPAGPDPEHLEGWVREKRFPTLNKVSRRGGGG